MTDREKRLRRLIECWEITLEGMPNEGNRLPMAKSHFDQALYWLRINLDVHQARLMSDEKVGTGEADHGRQSASAD